MTTKVKLRQKEISGNRQSLYLDFYPPILKEGEKTRREFLGLYIFNETIKDKKGNLKKVKLNPIDKKHNKETQELANQIRQKRDNLLNKPEIYTELERVHLKQQEKGQFSFIEYFKALADKRKASNHDNWISAYHYLVRFSGGTLKFSEVTEKFCNDFKDYLLTTKTNRSDKRTLSQNSVVSYFNKLKASLKQAYKDGFIHENINSKIDTVKPAEVQRKFLTLQELNKLVKTECTIPILKQAAIFSALTGLRFSDIEKLVWNELEYVKGQGYFIHFKQQKTKGVEVLPISKQAYSLLGKRKDSSEKVFVALKYSAWTNLHLTKWLIKAGITKDISFHGFRHTFATLQLSKGTDIYTVSKLLGHRELKTTQIYAKVIDETKRKAVDKIRINLR